MTDKQHHTAEKLIGVSFDKMDAHTKKVARHINDRKHISKNTTAEQETNKTFGQTAADAVAKFGGSWTFIILFASCTHLLGDFKLNYFG